jgi:hypothetical protein
MSQQGLLRASRIPALPAWRRGAGVAGVAAWVASHRGHVIVGTIVVLYVLIFARGLAWQWQGILGGSREAPPAAASLPPANASSSRAGAPDAPAAAAAPAAAPRTREPLPPTDEPPPRGTTDKYGVYYDAQGVAVIGIDADPSGVYNVPAGRQLRIGGPSGTLFDVQVGGKLTPATSVRPVP